MKKHKLVIVDGYCSLHTGVGFAKSGEPSPAYASGILMPITNMNGQ